MTLETLDNYINNIMSLAKKNKEVKNIGRVEYKIKHSNKTKSLYVKFYYSLNCEMYTKTIRFSDHESSYNMSGIIFDSYNKQLSKSEKTKVKELILKSCKRLIRKTGLKTIYKELSKFSKHEFKIN